MPATLRSRLTPALLGLGLLVPALVPAHDAPGEYFFNTDPGIGAATPLPLPDPPPATLAEIEFVELPIPAASVGEPAQAMLGLRFRNDDGEWGPTRLLQLHLVPGLPEAPLALAWGSSPATSATPSGDGLLTLTRPAAATGDADALTIRTRFGDASGPATIRRVFPFGGATATLAVGWGSDTPVEVAVGPDGTATFTRPVSASGDADQLVIRTRAGTGGYEGPAFSFRVHSVGTASPTRLYYALDQTPDPASSPYVEISDEQRLAPGELELDLGDAAPGFRTLHLQLHDSAGGRTHGLRHLHVTEGVRALAGLAYSFKPEGREPGLAADVAPLYPAAGYQDVSLLPPAELPLGVYTLVLQLADLHADLGFTTTAGLFLDSSYDFWARSALAGRPAAETGPLADPDGDGIVNLLEYAFGLDPLQRDASPPYFIRNQSTSGGSPFFVVEYRQREGGTGQPGIDYTAAGLRYVVEGSTDLQSWTVFTELPGLAHHRSTAINGDGTETVRMEIFHGPLLETAKRVFLRLKISAAP